MVSFYEQGYNNFRLGVPTCGSGPAGLSALYSATQGLDWTSKKQWLSGDPCTNSWYGVTCSVSEAEGKRITGFDVSSNDLDGTLPTEIGLLTAVTSRVYMNGNSLKGSLPSEIGSMTAMSSHMYFQCSLNGTLPTELGRLSVLKTYLHAESNSFSGSVPTEFGAMTGLFQYIHLQSNQLTGSLPSELGQTFNELPDSAGWK